MPGWTSGACVANGIDIHYLRTGAGQPTPGAARPPLILLHGLIGSGACWTPVARALEADCDVLMPDARGHGRSSTPTHGYRYDDLASDALGFIRALGLAAPIVLGHSMGGMTAAVAASRGAGLIRGVILVDPTFLTPERQREVYESDVAEQHRRLLAVDRGELLAQQRARQPHRSPELIELLVEARLQTRMSAFEVLRPPNPDYRKLVRAIDVPGLLVIGDAPVVSLETARELETLNPRLRVEQIAGAGHGVPYDQPERLAAAVGSFIRSLAPA
ncbi:MAG TPA: alpha/beta hydrolase [Polyangia bacterium]|nr:alpha/beta hydrolase [Polyangia bacterium]